MKRPQLGLQPDQVLLVEHDPLWKKEYEQISSELLQQLPSFNADRIQHIGSTAIMGLQAKPIIDIALGVEKQESQWSVYDQPLRAIGFYRLQVRRQQEAVFARFADAEFRVKTHFIHMIPYGSEHWLDMLFFRDYMNAHEEARQQYAQLKMDFTTRQQHGIAEYTEYKEQFIQHIFSLRKG
ncbi:GrpB family protein [Paenibacillus sp. WLX1005]|uniref:GrpB family protein n=1 Tax=Paenibacillus sp. WLX1005 TaxID=3243766 RepID=UPI003984537B